VIGFSTESKTGKKRRVKIWLPEQDSEEDGREATTLDMENHPSRLLSPSNYVELREIPTNKLINANTNVEVDLSGWLVLLKLDVSIF